jgi:hypothetical protein
MPLNSMQHLTKFVRETGFAMPTYLKMFFGAILAMSVACDCTLQIIAGVETAAIIAILIADALDDGDLLHRLLIVIAAIIFTGIILIILGTIFYPLTGKFATFLHWHAIILTLALISLVAVSIFTDSYDRDSSIGWVIFMALTLDVMLVFALWIFRFH